MNELINIKNDEAVKVIGKAIKENKYDIAADLLMSLNACRYENGLKPYSISDMLFLNFTEIMSDDTQKQKEKKSVYIIEFSDGSVKIGVSKTPKQRAHNLSKQSGKKISNYWYSQLLENAFEIEHSLHSHFKEHRLEGEYFNVNYLEALEAVKDKYDLDVSVSESIYRRHKEVAI